MAQNHFNIATKSRCFYMTQPFWHNKLGRLLQHGTHGQDAGKTHALIPCGCLGPSPARVFQNRGNSWRSMKLSIIKHVDMHANYWGPQEWMVYSKEPAICGSIDISLLTLCCPVCGSCNAIDWTNHQWSSVESVHNLRGIIRSIFLISETSFYLYIYVSVMGVSIRRKPNLMWSMVCCHPFLALGIQKQWIRQSHVTMAYCGDAVPFNSKFIWGSNHVRKPWY